MRTSLFSLSLIIAVMIVTPCYTRNGPAGPGTVSESTQETVLPYVPGELLVKFKKNPGIQGDSAGKLRSSLKGLNKVIRRFNIKAMNGALRPGKPVPPGLNLNMIYRAEFDEDMDVEKTARAFSSLPDVVYAEPVYVAFPHFDPCSQLPCCDYSGTLCSGDGCPDDPLVYGGNLGECDDTWHYSRPVCLQHNMTLIGGDAAWKATPPGTYKPVIAVIDMGVDIYHPDLINKIWINENEDVNTNGNADLPEDWNGDGQLDLSEDLNCNFHLDCDEDPGYDPGASPPDYFRIYHEDLDNDGLLFSGLSADGGDLDGIDQDGNGLIDDVAGWNFDNENNMPNWRILSSSYVNGYYCLDCTEEKWSHGGYDHQVRHGTAVAGIAAADTNNGIGTAGMCRNCRVMPIKGLSFSFIESVEYAVDMGADVINFSGGFVEDFYSSAAADMVEYAAYNGVQVVASAGNEKSIVPVYPASFEDVISVGGIYSTTREDSTAVISKKVRNSSLGYSVDVMAPGHLITAPWPDGYASYYAPYSSCPADAPAGRYGKLSGTSAASPQVAGLYGVLKSIHPNWTREERSNHIMGTASAVGSDNFTAGYEGLMGSGIIDVGRAVSVEKEGTPCLRVTATYIDDRDYSFPFSGNGNFVAEYGETVKLYIEIQNLYGSASGTSITLTPLNAVTIDDGYALYGDLPARSSGTDYKFTNPADDPFVISPLVSDKGFPAEFLAEITATASDGSPYTVEQRFRIRCNTLPRRKNFPFRTNDDFRDNQTERVLTNVVLNDVDGDGNKDAVFAVRKGGLQSGEHTMAVNALDNGGVMVPGYPVTFGDSAGWTSHLSVYEIDPLNSIFVCSVKSKLYAIKNDGTELVDGDADPLTFGVFALAPLSGETLTLPVLGDVNGDGAPETVCTGYDEAGSRIYAWDTSGTILPGFPVGVDRTVYPPAMADMDHDGVNEIVIDSRIIEGDGKDAAFSPVPGVLSGNESYVADIDENGHFDLVYCSEYDLNNQPYCDVHAVDLAGNELPGFPISGITGEYTGMAIGKINTNPGLALVLSTSECAVLIGNPLPDDLNFEILPGWPVFQEIFSRPCIADINGDGIQEAALQYNYPAPDRDFLFFYKQDGTEFPTDSYYYRISLAAGLNPYYSNYNGNPDVMDFNGRLTVFTGAEDMHLNAFDLGADIDIPWGTRRADAGSTNTYGTLPVYDMPLITSISPSSGSNTETVEVTISGDHFDNDTFVKIGEHLPLQKDVISARQIDILVPAKLMTGCYDISVGEDYLLSGLWSCAEPLEGGYTVTGEVLRDYKRFYSADGRDITISNARSGELIDTVTFADGPWLLEITGSDAYVISSNYNEGTVTFMDTATLGTTTIAAGTEPWGMDIAEDDSLLYTACLGGSISTVPVPPDPLLSHSYPVTGWPNDINIVPGKPGYFLYTDWQNGSLKLANIVSGAVDVKAIEFIEHPSTPSLTYSHDVEVTPDGSAAFVSYWDETDAFIRVVDIVMDETSGVYGLTLRQDAMYVYDIDRIGAGYPLHMSMEQDGLFITAEESGNGSLYKIDTGTYAMEKLIRYLCGDLGIDVGNPTFDNIGYTHAYTMEYESSGVYSINLFPQPEVEFQYEAIFQFDGVVEYGEDLTITEIEPSLTCNNNNPAFVISGKSITGDTSVYLLKDGLEYEAVTTDWLSSSSMAAHFENIPSGLYDVKAARGVKQSILNNIFWTAVPAITDLDPDSGSTSGGITVTLTGSGFRQNYTKVLFDGIPATDVTVISDEVLTAVTPSHEEGFSDVTVENRDQQGALICDAAQLDNGFYFLDPQYDFVMVPDHGDKEGGTFVTIYAHPGTIETGARAYFEDNQGNQIDIDILTLDDNKITGTTRSAWPGKYDVRIDNPTQPDLYRKNGWQYKG